MSQVILHYKDCTPEEIRMLERFEPEVQKSAAAKRLRGNVYWEGYFFKTQASEFRFFQLYVMTQPKTFLGGDYGAAFLRRASLDEFSDYVSGIHSSSDEQQPEPLRE